MIVSTSSDLGEEEEKEHPSRYVSVITDAYVHSCLLFDESDQFWQTFYNGCSTFRCTNGPKSAAMAGAIEGLMVKATVAGKQVMKNDMEIAPDIFDYFEAAAKLLDKDKTIMAVSSWNDNG